MGKTLLSLGLAALLLGSGTAYAQGSGEEQGKTPYGQRQHRQGGGKFMQSLGLSDEQKAQLKELRNLSREERQARLRQILTPEQYAKMQEMRSERRPRGPGWGQDLGLTEQQRQQMRELRNLSAEERQARLQQILTPEQLAKVQQHQENFKNRMGQRQQRFAQELGLSDSQQEQIRAAFQEMRQQGKSLSRDERREAMRTRLQAIMTPEQFQKFEQMKRQHRPGRPGRQG